MTSKERVLCALNHKTPDRVPRDLGGAACSLVDEAYYQLKACLGIQGDIEPYRKGANVCYYDERILEALEIDIRRVFACQSSRYPMHHEDGTFSNEWGLVQRDTGKYVEIVRNPLADAEVEDLAEYNWPSAQEMLIVKDMKAQAQKLFEENQYAISMRMPCNGIFEIACWLRGMENFMVDVMTDPEFAHALIEKITEKQIEWYSYMLDEVGPYVDIVETGDDYGSQKSLLMSPQTYREFIFPARKRLNAAIKAKAPQSKIFLHSCGAISEIIEDLIDCGVDILNPVQTAAHNMDPKALKEKFGTRICFHGAIDTQRTMLGSTKDVENEVAQMIELLGKDGGYILSSCNHIQADIPSENIIKLFEIT